MTIVKVDDSKMSRSNPAERRDKVKSCLCSLQSRCARIGMVTESSPGAQPRPDFRGGFAAQRYNPLGSTHALCTCYAKVRCCCRISPSPAVVTVESYQQCRYRIEKLGSGL